MSSPSKLVDLRRTSDEPRRIAVKNARPPRDDQPQRPRKPLRKRRQHIRLIIAVVIAFCIGAATYGVHIVSYLPQYTIQHIVVDGAQRMPVAVLEDYVKTILYPKSRPFIARANFLVYGPKALAESITRNFPRIESTRVFRTTPFSDTVVIRITERRTYALWCTTTCFAMDERGRIFSEASLDTPTDTGYIFSGGSTSSAPVGMVFAEGHFAGLVLLLKHLNDAGYAPRGVHIVDDKDFSVPLGAGFSVKGSYGEDAGVVVRNLKLVLDSASVKTATTSLEYVDLRFGDRVYYKLRSDVSSTVGPR